MKIVEVLRLSDMGLTQREIGLSAGCGKSTVGDILRLCKEKGVTYEMGLKMTDEELHETLYPKKEKKDTDAPEPDWKMVHEELTKHKKLNLQFMWEEYRELYPDGLSYSRFCVHYRQYRKTTDRQVTLYNERKAGDTMEVDWMGDTLECIVDGKTGEITAAHFFLSVLGYSQYPYVEAFPNEQETNWITAHVNALNYYGGIPRIIIPDNCRTSVTTPRYYEPIINSAYWELAQHYGVAIIPARVKKPRDKNLVENGVGWLETWLLGKLRNQRFFGYPELNKEIRKQTLELAAKPFKKREGSRYIDFVGIDKPALRPLPVEKFEIADVVFRKVGDNYHLEYDKFRYSVPYTLHNEQVVLRATNSTIEIFDKTRTRVASHRRRYTMTTKEGRYITNEDHMPSNHRFVHQFRQFDGNRYRSWAKKIGVDTYFIIDNILASGKVEEQGFKSCMGILQFSKKYSEIRLEAACRRARELGSHTYTTIKNILKNGTENVDNSKVKATPQHENIRGSEYYN